MITSNATITSQPSANERNVRRRRLRRRRPIAAPNSKLFRRNVERRERRRRKLRESLLRQK